MALNFCVLLKAGKAVTMLAVLDTDLSFITKYGGVFDLMNINEFTLVFDLMNINEFSVSVTTTVGRLLICRVGADQLLTSDITPSVVTRTFIIKKPTKLVNGVRMSKGWLINFFP